MSAVLITGCAGAGKSAIAEVLALRDLACIDDDEDLFLARFVDPAGAVVAEEPAQPDFAWLSRHSWQWDPARLDDLIRAAAPRRGLSRVHTPPSARIPEPAAHSRGDTH